MILLNDVTQQLMLSNLKNLQFSSLELLVPDPFCKGSFRTVSITFEQGRFYIQYFCYVTDGDSLKEAYDQLKKIIEKENITTTLNLP